MYTNEDKVLEAIYTFYHQGDVEELIQPCMSDEKYDFRVTSVCEYRRRHHYTSALVKSAN